MHSQEQIDKALELLDHHGVTYLEFKSGKIYVNAKQFIEKGLLNKRKPQKTLRVFLANHMDESEYIKMFYHQENDSYRVARERKNEKGEVVIIFFTFDFVMSELLYEKPIVSVCGVNFEFIMNGDRKFVRYHDVIKMIRENNIPVIYGNEVSFIRLLNLAPGKDYIYASQSGDDWNFSEVRQNSRKDKLFISDETAKNVIERNKNRCKGGDSNLGVGEDDKQPLEMYVGSESCDDGESCDDKEESCDDGESGDDKEESCDDDESGDDKEESCDDEEEEQISVSRGGNGSKSETIMLLPEAPKVIELDDDKHFVDNSNKIIKIEVRYDDGSDIYFDATDIQNGFKIPDIEKFIENEPYVAKIDYIYMRVKLNSVFVKKLFITFKGLTLIILTKTRSNAQSYFNKALEILHSVKMNDKIDFIPTLSNFDLSYSRKLLQIFGDRVPCIYVLQIGKVRELYNSWKISKKINGDYNVIKYGSAINFSRRALSHLNEIGKHIPSGVSIKVCFMVHISPNHLRSAEIDVSRTLEGWGVGYKYNAYTELAIVSDRQLKDLHGACKRFADDYRSRKDDATTALEIAERNLREKNRETQDIKKIMLLECDSRISKLKMEYMDVISKKDAEMARIKDEYTKIIAEKEKDLVQKEKDLCDLRYQNLQKELKAKDLEIELLKQGAK